MAITFSNKKFVYEHEKQPRGFGKWGFYINVADRELTLKNYPYEHYIDQNGYTFVWTSGVMTLTDAKNELKDWLIKNGYKDVMVYVAD